MTSQVGSAQIDCQSSGDIAHTAVRAVLSAIPGIGGPLVELFNSLIQPPLERRKAAWMEMVGEKLQELEASGINIEDLKNNDQFISAVMTATVLALRTHEQGKFEALCNAISNVAQRQSPDEARQQFFFNCIGEFSELQIRILKFFQAPPPAPRGIAIAGSLDQVLETQFPELAGQRYFYDQLWKDLHAARADKYWQPAWNDVPEWTDSEADFRSRRHVPGIHF